MKTLGLCLALALGTFLVGCGGGGGGGADAGQQTPPVTNTAPTANAGPIQNVVVGAAVILDGSGSDANGDALTYNWSLVVPSGSAASLSAGTTPKPTFVVDVAGTYTATLVVNDGKVNSAAATVTVTAAVANAAPVANAGVAQNVVAGTLVTLDGSASSDANGDPLTYSWSLTGKPAGSAAAFTLATIAKPTFTADLAGTYVASLTVNDGKVNSTAAMVTVTVAVNDFGSTPLFDVRVIDNAALRAVGDFNGDGRLDLIAEVPGATSFEEPKAYIYRQEADGQFSKIALSIRLPFAFAAEADFNRDGSDDLPTLPLGGSCALSVMFFAPDLLSFTTTTGLAPGTCATPTLRALDFDGDGKIDLVPLSSSATVVYLGTGTQSFNPLQLQKPFALQGDMLAAADLDGDGTVDLLAANSNHGSNQVSISIAYGAGAGKYTDVKNWVYPNLTQGYSSPSGPAFVADFNNDGFKDVLYCPGSISCQLILGDGPQSFRPTAQLVSLTGNSVAVADMNGDGNVDVVVSSSSGVQIRLGDGKGNFAAAVMVPGSAGSFSSQFRIADINKDGKLDLILTIDGVLRVFTQR